MYENPLAPCLNVCERRTRNADLGGKLRLGSVGANAIPPYFPTYFPVDILRSHIFNISGNKRNSNLTNLKVCYIVVSSFVILTSRLIRAIFPLQLVQGHQSKLPIVRNRPMRQGNLAEEIRTHPICGRDQGQDLDETTTIKLGNNALEFSDLKITDPMPTGRQIIEAGGFEPAEEFLIFLVSPDHWISEVKLDETVDIRGHGEEQFLIFKSDRSWRALINGKRFEWGEEAISGRVLKWLAQVDAKSYGVWLEVRDEPDQLIKDSEQVSLTSAGVERFRTDLLIQVCIEDVLHPWSSRTITTEEIAALGGWEVSQGVIEVDSDQNERTLAPKEVVELRQGVSFGKKLRFKRG